MDLFFEAVGIQVEINAIHRLALGQDTEKTGDCYEEKRFHLSNDDYTKDIKCLPRVVLNNRKDVLKVTVSGVASVGNKGKYLL